jgi:hypothetical protein
MPWRRKSDAQVDRAHAREPVQHLLDGVGRVLLGDGGHQREAGGGIERRADHAAVQAAVEVVPDELRPHVEAQAEAPGIAIESTLSPSTWLKAMRCSNISVSRATRRRPPRGCGAWRRRAALLHRRMLTACGGQSGRRHR